MSRPVLLVLGAGPGIGLFCARLFSAKGYKVALTSRSRAEGIDEDGYLNIRLDLADTKGIQAAFAKVSESLGIPHVVIFNGYDRSVRDPKDPLSSISVDGFLHETATNIAGPLFAAQEAVKGFKELPETASRTFIQTGNKLNVVPAPPVLTFGMGKRAAAYMLECASIAYKSEGFRFYFADQRQSDGGASVPPDGPAHASTYLQLAEDKEQRPWYFTFVKDIGYVSFDEAANLVDFKGPVKDYDRSNS
ncbi:hypothetical protein N0V82_007512 [Gnomoniopsis sp. IMI 355080]|nr:hypothetical protein N0V82_007512 [Gnomoniopsis sp. IMI 355080]